MKISIDQFVLGDTANGVFISNLRVNRRSIVQEASRVRADEMEFLDRKNTRTSITFTSSRNFEDAGQAENFLVDHTLDMPRQGLVEILMTRPDGREVKRWIRAAIDEGHEGSHTGATTFHNYSIVGGLLLQEKP